MKAHLMINGIDVDAYELWCALAALVEPPPGYRIRALDESPTECWSGRWWSEGRWRDYDPDRDDIPLLWASPIRTAGLPEGERWLGCHETAIPGDRLACESPRMFARKMTTRERESLARKGR